MQDVHTLSIEELKDLHKRLYAAIWETNREDREERLIEKYHLVCEELGKRLNQPAEKTDALQEPVDLSEEMNLYDETSTPEKVYDGLDKTDLSLGVEAHARPLEERLQELDELFTAWETPSRHEENREILKLLSRVVEKYPKWRFGQLLRNCGIISPRDSATFNIESSDILQKLSQWVKDRKC